VLPDGAERYFERISQIPEIVLELLGDDQPKADAAQ
jgi:hypothetical protein